MTHLNLKLVLLRHNMFLDVVKTIILTLQITMVNGDEIPDWANPDGLT